MRDLPRVLVVSHHFYPSGLIGAKRMSEFVLCLMRNGIEVKVLSRLRDKKLRHAELASRVSAVDKTDIWAPQPILDRLMKILPSARSIPKHQQRTPQERSVEEVTSSSKKRHTWRQHYRAAENLIDRNKLWSILAAMYGVVLRLRRRYDVVISSGPPMSAHLAALVIVKAHGARWIADFRDPWVASAFASPENFPRWRLTLEYAARDACTKRCSHVVCASSGIYENIVNSQSRGADKSTVITNGFDWRLPPKLPVGRLDLLYAGSLYYNRNPFPLFEAVADLIANDRVNRHSVNMTFVGYCDSFRGMSTREWIDEHGLTDVIRIKKPVAPDNIRTLIAESNVLVNFAQEQPFQIPGKTFEYIGASRYMLVITEDDSVTAQLVRQSGAGVVVPPDCPERLGSVLENLYNRFVCKGEGFVPDEDHIIDYSRDMSNNKLLKIVLSEYRNRQAC